MFLSQLLDEYKESDNKKEIFNKFLKSLWNSKYTFKKYTKRYKYKIVENLLGNRKDLIDLFNKYNNIEYMVCRSETDVDLSSIDYIRIHINNMYGFLFDKDVYYNSKYYKLLSTAKNEYFKAINNNNISASEIEHNIITALQEAELVKQQSISKKYNMSFKEYKKLINGFLEKIFNNYINIEEYERRYGWQLDVTIDGWCDENYVVSYFCKSLTGYLRNYVKKMKKDKKYCSVCGIEIDSRKRKYCEKCAAQKEKIRKRNWKKKVAK